MSVVETEEQTGKVIYSIRRLSWAEGRDLLRKAIKSKDPMEYIEELIIASVARSDGTPLNKEILGKLPSSDVRRLMDETLRLNDISRPEANFLPT